MAGGFSIRIGDDYAAVSLDDSPEDFERNMAEVDALIARLQRYADREQAQRPARHQFRPVS